MTKELTAAAVAISTGTSAAMFTVRQRPHLMRTRLPMCSAFMPVASRLPHSAQT